MTRLQKSIEERQAELQLVTNILAYAARKSAFRATLSKVLVIFLGAFTATRGVMDQLVGGTDDKRVLLVYTAAGLLTVVIAGLETAFKTESKSAELKQLAATCQATLRLVDTQWRKEVGPAYDEERTDDERIKAVNTLLDLQDAKLGEIQQQAARLGLNIVYDVYILRNEEPNRSNYLA